jgi:hypothetical protein
MTFHILGMSSSQLTKSIIFQRGRAHPATSKDPRRSRSWSWFVSRGPGSPSKKYPLYRSDLYLSGWFFTIFRVWNVVISLGPVSRFVTLSKSRLCHEVISLGSSSLVYFNVQLFSKRNYIIFMNLKIHTNLWSWNTIYESVL